MAMCYTIITIHMNGISLETNMSKDSNIFVRDGRVKVGSNLS